MDLKVLNSFSIGSHELKFCLWHSHHSNSSSNCGGRAQRRNVGALKFSNLLQPDRFEEDLQISRVRLRPPPPAPATPPPPPLDPAEQQRRRQRALECLRQLKATLR